MINESLGYSFLGKILQAKGLLSDAFLAFLCQIKICELPEFRKMPEESIKIWDPQTIGIRKRNQQSFLKKVWRVSKNFFHYNIIEQLRV